MGWFNPQLDNLCFGKEKSDASSNRSFLEVVPEVATARPSRENATFPFLDGNGRMDGITADFFGGVGGG